MSSTRTAERKQANRAKNEDQHDRNKSIVKQLGIPEATSEHRRTRRDGKGKPYEVVVTKRVQESKQIRSYYRSLRHLQAARAAAAVAAAASAAQTTPGADAI